MIIFWYPWCPEYGLLWSSFITVSLISLIFFIYSLVLWNNSPCWFRLKSVSTFSYSFLAVFSFKLWYSPWEFPTLTILFPRSDSLLANNKFRWRLRVSTTLFYFPFICLILKSYLLKKDNHLPCLVFKLCLSIKYLRLKCYLT